MTGKTRLIMLSSFISPYRAERNMVRNLVTGGTSSRCFVDTPIEGCMRRDPKEPLRQGPGR